MNANISIEFSLLKNVVPDNTPSPLKAPKQVDQEWFEIRRRHYDMRTGGACVHWVRPNAVKLSHVHGLILACKPDGERV